MSTYLAINLKRVNKVYYEGESIVGVVVVDSSSDVRHEGLTLLMEGVINLQLSTKNVGIFEAFSNSVKLRRYSGYGFLQCSCYFFPEIRVYRVLSTYAIDVGFDLLLDDSFYPTKVLCDKLYQNPMPNLNHTYVFYLHPTENEVSQAEDVFWIEPITLVNTSLELVPGGKIPVGCTEIPFELPLRSRPGGPALLETYHGVFVNVMYTLKASMRRSFLNKPLNATCQFFVQYPLAEAAVPKPVRCEITPGTIRAGGGSRSPMPQFQIYAEIDSTVCALDKPLTGKIRVEESHVAIKSIELQLVRVETCGCAEGYSRDATEIQNVQVGDGDVCRARDVPLRMVLPRLFTCPTTATPNFKIEFELNIAVIFEDDYLVTENFPILLVRSR